MGMMAITINGAQPENIFMPFVVASSAIASGDDVILFFTPGGAPALVKGVMEKMTGKGMPELMELVEGYQLLGGRILMCELSFEANGFTEEDLREGVEVVGATTFINEAKNATLTFSF